MLIQFIFISVLICLTSTQSNNCSIRRELDSKITNLFGSLGIKSVRWAETETEMDEFCRLNSIESSAAKSFVQKCLNGVSKTLMSVSIYAAVKVNLKLNCNKKVERIAYLSRAKCGNKAKKNTAKCWNKLIDDINAIKNVTDSKLKIPSLCCKVYQWKTCSMDAIKEVGPPLCSDKDIDGFEKTIDRGSLDPMNMFCSDYNDESDKCDQVLKKFPKIKTNNKKRDKTVFPGIISVFEDL